MAEHEGERDSKLRRRRMQHTLTYLLCSRCSKSSCQLQVIQSVREWDRVPTSVMSSTTRLTRRPDPCGIKILDIILHVSDLRNILQYAPATVTSDWMGHAVFFDYERSEPDAFLVTSDLICLKESMKWSM